jgi:seryl-tRNA synthetase
METSRVDGVFFSFPTCKISKAKWKELNDRAKKLEQLGYQELEYPDGMSKDEAVRYAKQFYKKQDDFLKKNADKVESSTNKVIARLQKYAGQSNIIEATAPKSDKLKNMERMSSNLKRLIKSLEALTEEVNDLGKLAGDMGRKRKAEAEKASVETLANKQETNQEKLKRISAELKSIVKGLTSVTDSVNKLGKWAGDAGRSLKEESEK